MSSFIGCKISLISKAGIRYEGILYTIDPKESTVALSKVKSFGTEDRKVERAIPSRDEIYEYIIFRGSDIQDLNVCERNKESTLLMEDSAIVRAETSISGNLPPGVLMTGQNQNDLAAGGDRRLPSSNKSVNNATKTQQQSNDDNNLKQGRVIQPIGSNRHNHQNSDNKKPLVRKNETYVNGQTDVKIDVPKVRQERPQKTAENYASNYDYKYNYDMGYKYGGNSYHGSSNYGSHRDYNNYEKPAVRYRRSDYRQDQYYAADNNKLRGFESSENGRDYAYSQYYDYKSSRQNQERYSYDTNIPKTKRRANNSENGKQKDVAFKEDYDFETANAIIAKELANMHISQDKKDLKDEEEGPKEDGEVYEELDAACYDKNKSFFDKISSEMIDRANGKIVRPMNRKEERKINVETFGVAETGRTFGRGTSKWTRGSRYGSRPARGHGYVDAVYRGGSGESYAKRDARSYVNGR